MIVVDTPWDKTKTMKIIGLMIVKNEGWILETTLPQINKYCDEILAIMGDSSDNTLAILKKYDVSVLQQTESDNYSAWRQKLLEWGRSRGGTHFICIDADEAFTNNFFVNFRQTFSLLKPGQKLVMDWLCLWKNPYKLRTDNSVWSNNDHDFVFCDDGVSRYGSIRLHEPRTPGLNTKENTVRINRENGAVLHFQFVPFERFQMKQAYQRCREYVLKTVDIWSINQKYSITLDDPNATCIDMPSEWIQNFVNLSKLSDIGPDWYYPAICNYFSQYGVKYFEPLDIWHIPQLRNIFIQETGRMPKPLISPPLKARFFSFGIRIFHALPLPDSAKASIRVTCLKLISRTGIKVITC